MRRLNLERDLLILKNRRGEERIRAWKDLLWLKKELREAIEQYDLILASIKI
jgi:hypothetical protein